MQPTTKTKEVIILPAPKQDTQNDNDPRATLYAEFMKPLAENADKVDTTNMSNSDVADQINEMNGNYTVQQYLQKVYKSATKNLEKKARGMLNKNLGTIYTLQTQLTTQKSSLVKQQNVLQTTVNTLQKDINKMSTVLGQDAQAVSDLKDKYDLMQGEFVKYTASVERLVDTRPEHKIEHKVFENGIKDIAMRYKSKLSQLEAKKAYYTDVVAELRLQQEHLSVLNYNIQLIDNDLHRIDHQRRVQEEGNPLANILHARKTSSDVLNLEKSVTENLKKQRALYNSKIGETDLTQDRFDLSASKESIDDLLI